MPWTGSRAKKSRPDIQGTPEVNTFQTRTPAARSVYLPRMRGQGFHEGGRKKCPSLAWPDSLRESGHARLGQLGQPRETRPCETRPAFNSWNSGRGPGIYKIEMIVEKIFNLCMGAPAPEQQKEPRCTW